MTLHRLRKALGRSDWIVLEDDRYRPAPGVRCALDAARFESEIPLAIRALGADEDTGAALAAGLEAYRGDFLEAESVGDW